MEKNPRFFIYDRKEVGVLLLLGVMVAVFAFTLGVHLGKRVGGRPSVSVQQGEPPPGISPIAQEPTTAENDVVLNQPSENTMAAQSGSNEVLTQALHEEVGRTGIKMDDPRQLELPKKTISKNAGATTPTKQGNAVSHGHAKNIQAALGKIKKALAPLEDKPAEGELVAGTSEEASDDGSVTSIDTAHAALHGKHPFTLQIGAYANLKEAQDRVKDLEISGLEAQIHAANLKGKGRWYQIHLGEYVSKAAAQRAGERYRTQGMIDSFFVAKFVE